MYNEVRFKVNGYVFEFGGGNNPMFHPNIDIISGPNVDFVADFNKPLPIETEAVDGIFSRYAIEHIEWRNVKKFLKECFRILKKNGKIVMFLPNLLEQCKKVVEIGVNEGSVEMLFGSQEFPNHAGCHKNGFSPEYIEKLLKEIGFSLVRIFSHPDSKTDMIVEAYKGDEVYERSYFEDGIFGYESYNNFCTHYTTAGKIMERKPESVFEIGCGRGYVVRILQNSDIPSYGMDISKHCWHTRATDNFILGDMTKTPWPLQEDDRWDLCFSINTLEHVPEDKLDDVLREMARVTNRGMHGVHMIDSPFIEFEREQDLTHFTLKTKSWWEERFKAIIPDYPVEIIYQRELEYTHPEKQPPLSFAPGCYVREGDDKTYLPKDGLAKINVGCYMDMFYYGWINTDTLDMTEFAKPGGYIFKQHDAIKEFPMDDNTIDIIFTSHMIEHLSRRDAKKFLKECFRMLKPGKLLRISFPDARLITKKYLDGTISDYRYINQVVDGAHDDAESFYEMLVSNHKTCYDFDSMKKVLSEMGFINIEESTPFTSRSKTIQEQTITTHPTISCVIEAEKPVQIRVDLQ